MTAYRKHNQSRAFTEPSPSPSPWSYRISRIIFRNVLLNLSHHIGTNISGLRVNASAQLHEQRDKRCTKTIAGTIRVMGMEIVIGMGMEMEIVMEIAMEKWMGMGMGMGMVQVKKGM